MTNLYILHVLIILSCNCPYQTRGPLWNGQVLAGGPVIFRDIIIIITYILIHV